MGRQEILQKPSRKHRGHLKSFIMARGNQRDKAREANQKKMADMKKGNSMSGSEMQREKEKVAAKMREKQAAADAKKAAEGARAAKKKKALIRSRKVIRQYEDTYATLRRSSYGLTWICFGVLDQSSVEAWDAWLRCLDCVD